MYNRIKAKYFSAPVLMEQSEVDKYLSILSQGNSEDRVPILSQTESPTNNVLPEGASYLEETRVGVINISGPLTYKSSGMEMLCGDGGMSNYQAIEMVFKDIAELGAKVIVTMLDTPGGEAYGCFETAKNMRAIAEAYGVRWIAYNDGIVASAGYALAAPAHEIIVNPASETGSIGVVATLLNKSGELAQKGHERTFVYAGENKIPYDEEGKFRQEHIDDVQSKVNLMYIQFVNHVSQYRPMSENEVRGTKASMFIAEEALLNHLADKMMTRIEFADYVGKTSEELIALERNPQERKPMSIVLECKETRDFIPHPEGIHPAVCVDVIDLGLVDAVWRARAYGDFWSHVMVAEGCVDIAPEPELNLWDMAALVPVVREAGGRMTGWSGPKTARCAWLNATPAFESVTPWMKEVMPGSAARSAPPPGRPPSRAASRRRFGSRA
mgnify:CR=1 FL=1